MLSRQAIRSKRYPRVRTELAPGLYLGEIGLVRFDAKYDEIEIRILVKDPGAIVVRHSPLARGNSPHPLLVRSLLSPLQIPNRMLLDGPQLEEAFRIARGRQVLIQLVESPGLPKDAVIVPLASMCPDCNQEQQAHMDSLCSGAILRPTSRVLPQDPHHKNPSQDLYKAAGLRPRLHLR